MDWDDLKLFLAVARSGRLAAAGKRLRQDATTIGRRLHRLEQTLGILLFEQTANGHVLTARGVDLLAHVETMETAALEIEELAGVRATAVAGTIRVSVSEGFGTAVIAQHLAKFAADHPLIQVELIASSGFLNPSRREADVAVMLARPKAGPLIARRLTNYRLGLYARADYVHAHPPIAVAADLLQGHRVIGYIPDQIYAAELRYLPEVHPRLEASIRSSSINAQAELIAAGSGCGILPCFLGDRHPALIRLLTGEVDIERSFWLVLHRDMQKIVRVTRFTEWLTRLVAEMQPTLLGLPAMSVRVNSYDHPSA